MELSVIFGPVKRRLLFPHSSAIFVMNLIGFGATSGDVLMTPQYWIISLLRHRRNSLVFQLLSCLVTIIAVTQWAHDTLFRGRHYRRRQLAIILVRFATCYIFVACDSRYNLSPDHELSRAFLDIFFIRLVGISISWLSSYLVMRQGLAVQRSRTLDVPFGAGYRICHDEVEAANGQVKAIERLKGPRWPESRMSTWYQPLTIVQPRKDFTNGLRPYDALEGVPDDDDTDEGSLFSRCYCCLVSDAPRQIEEMEERRNEYGKNWLETRTQFLELLPHIVNAEPEDSQGLPIHFTATPHMLCDLCESIFKYSSIGPLDMPTTKLPSSFTFSGLRRAWRGQQTVKIRGPTKSSKPKSTHHSDMFEHWPSATKLARSAQDGCHLCNLIWDTLSIGQQAELLTADASMTSELAAVQASDEYDQDHYTRLEEQFRKRRGILIVLEKDKTFSLTAIGDPSNFTTLWQNHMSPRGPPRIREFRLIPHFGSTNVARGWINERLYTRARSQNMDPSTLWYREQADAIYLNTISKKPGAIILPISKSTGSDDSMMYIKRWLNVHIKCKPHQISLPRIPAPVLDSLDSEVSTDGGNIELLPLLSDESLDSQDYQDFEPLKLPTRLIDVNPEGGQGRRIKIVDAAVLEQNQSLDSSNINIAYLALSHCWGEAKFLTMNQSNIQRFQRGVPITELCPTFTDAISVTQRLGYRYLWIDSLCIIQGSASDWKREAGTMQDVYANADLVIAALACWDSSESFFVDQNPLAMSPALVGVTNTENSSYGYYAEQHRKYTQNDDQDISLSRLQSRGWCFQEEKLAARIVYFGTHQILLKCKATGESFYSMCSQADHRSIRHPKSSNNKKPASTKFLLTTKWWYIVEEYSGRFLTNHSDKLIALSGIVARQQKEAGGTVYLAGLWGGRYLTTGLLWYVHSRRQEPRHQPYIAPSWSWASVEGTIKNNSYDGSESMCKLDIIEVMVKGPNPNGAGESTFPLGLVSSGEMRVRGNLRTATWKSQEEPKKYYIGHRRPDYEIESVGQLGFFIPWTHQPTSGPEVYSLCDDSGRKVGLFLPDAAHGFPEVLHCLQIDVVPEQESRRDEFRYPFVTRGLALVPVYGTVDTFRRVGYIELDGTPGGFLPPTVVSGSLSKRSPELPIRRPWPETDIHGFFDKCDPIEFYII